jgi:acyl carrier protein
MHDKIRAVVLEFGRLPVDVSTLKDDADLYTAGLTSFASVQLMLGIEDAFDIEFPERMLNRRSFASIKAIAESVAELTSEKAAA